MFSYLSLPIVFLKFWFIEAPFEIISFFLSLNHSFLRLFSLPVLARTFFDPLKNEYRQGLVGFSIGMGILVKSTLILVDLLMFSVLVSLEIIFLISFVLLPPIAFYILLR